MRSAGRRARRRTRRAREVAALIDASAAEIVFTSGATESNNLALKGAVGAHRDRGKHIVTVATEHKSVLEVCLPVPGRRGSTSPCSASARAVSSISTRSARAITPGTILVSVMAANNEIGAIQPLAEIGAIVHERGALFHTDAAQAAGKIPIDVRAMDIDLLSLTAHKFYGPKGSGALFMRRRSRGSRSCRRSSAAARKRACGPARSTCRASSASAGPRRSAASRWRTKDAGSPPCATACSRGCAAASTGVRVNGTLEHRLPHNLHVSFDGVDGEALLMALGDLAVSTGSACASGSQAPSHVLQAIGATSDRAGASIRFGLGRTTTDGRHRFRDRPRLDRRRGAAPADSVRLSVPLNVPPEGGSYTPTL